MPQAPFMSDSGLIKKQIIAICKYYLSAFNDEQVIISEQTIHNQVLSDSDGLTVVTSSKRLYKAMVIWAMKANNHPIKNWPDGWMDLSVNDLADKLN